MKVIEGHASPERRGLVENEIVIGREASCGVLIDDPAVSRRHARLVLGAEGYFLEDLGSRNRTYLNGKRLANRVLLKPGDRIGICTTVLLFQSTLAPVQEGTEENDGTGVLSSIDASSTLTGLHGPNAEARLQAVLRITQALGSTLELEGVLDQMLDGLFDVFPGADRGLVLLCEQEQLVPRATKLRREPADNIRFSRTIVRKAITERQAILSEDARWDAQIPSESLLGLPIRSVMCAPLLAQDSTALGVIQLDTDDPKRKFDATDLQILTTVAVQASLSIQFTQLHSEKLRHAKLERELELAKQVQHSFLPVADPEVPSYRFWSHYQSADEVGGDFYDYLGLPGGKLAVLLGDVAGKGIPAALMMAKISACCKLALLSSSADLSGAMNAVNREVCYAEGGINFVTLVVCVLDPATHEITMASAGHMSPIMMRRDGSIEEPMIDTVRGVPLGVLPEFCYQTQSVRLEPGECVLLYSDGLTDALSPAGELYSSDRIRRHLATLSVRSPEHTGKSLLKDIRRHVAGCAQFDDISLVVFGRGTE